jgi:hypothetical protein
MRNVGRPETHPVKKVIGFSEEMIKLVETWRAKQKPVPNVSEAIRRLVELGLTVKNRPKQSTPARAERAKELAGKVIDSFSTDAADVEETASRKRRLLKGPEEFRDVRVDRAKKK